MVQSCRTHGNAQIQTGGRRKHDGTPLSAHMCEINPQIFFPPRKLPPGVAVGIDALSKGIEYL